MINQGAFAAIDEMWKKRQEAQQTARPFLGPPPAEGQSPPDMAPQGLIEQTMNALSGTEMRVRAMAERLETIADRVFGFPPPKAAECAPDQGPANSQSDVLNMIASGVHGQLNRLLDVVERIERI